MKPVRKSDPKLLEEVRGIPCLACLSRARTRAQVDEWLESGSRSHPHHVISKKSGGPDLAANIMALCPGHHQMVHSRGLTYMADNFQVIQSWLLAGDWFFDAALQKWRPPFAGVISSDHGSRREGPSSSDGLGLPLQSDDDRNGDGSADRADHDDDQRF